MIICPQHTRKMFNNWRHTFRLEFFNFDIAIHLYITLDRGTQYIFEFIFHQALNLLILSGDNLLKIQIRKV